MGLPYLLQKANVFGHGTSLVGKLLQERFEALLRLVDVNVGSPNPKEGSKVRAASIRRRSVQSILLNCSCHCLDLHSARLGALVATRGRLY